MSQADIAVIGLGVMGESLARNFHSRGLTVAGLDYKAEAVDRFNAEWGDARMRGHTDYAALAAALKSPRKILIMVTAGRAVDAVLAALTPHLDPEDIVIDGGNSHFPDTDRRVAETAGAFRFMGMGVSGGQEGALVGPAMMPGGDEAAYAELKPILESAAAVSDSGPCVDWCGRGSAGHFVKMVHNGIEYGDMQLIAEVATLMREGMSMSPPAIRRTFLRWNTGLLASFLIEITAGIVAAKDPRGEGPLLDAILDVAGQKGTGRWTAIGAIKLGVPLPTITAAVDARALSALKSIRVQAAALLSGEPVGLSGVSVEDLEAALYVAKLMSYTQGFAMLRAGAAERDYGTDLAAVARIWKAGCIIRAAFLDDVYAAFRTDPDLPLLLLDPHFADQLRPRLPALRRVVARSAEAGIPTPALSASLAYFDTLTRPRGSANIIQAQRDWFGAHTYRRVEAPDVPVHTDWSEVAQLED
ncbi:MAG: 6-phosphogluconate dehydrogenase [Myxococcota bacterium]|jgi:6-phosphogluconate dehydrogenase